MQEKDHTDGNVKVIVIKMEDNKLKDNIEKLKIDTQEVIINILKDSISDSKHIIKRLQATIVLLVCLLVGTFVYYEWSFKAFMSQYDYSNEIITTTNNDNKTFDKNSSINAHINDIKVNANKLK